MMIDLASVMRLLLSAAETNLTFILTIKHCQIIIHACLQAPTLMSVILNL